jgi:DNA recombination protein RmuC
MNVFLIGVVILLATLIAWLAFQSIQRKKNNPPIENQISELRRDLQTIANSQAQSAGQIQSIGQNVTQRLEHVTKALQDGVTDSAKIAAQGQSSLSTELKNTREQIERIQKQLGEVQELGRGMSLATQSLENVLGGAKTRGLLGEVTLEKLLEDSLPPSQYATQYRFSSGEAADAVIFLRDKKLMAIDSKFPLDAFRRIVNDGDDARKAFAAAVKGHADSVAKKYIVPHENTLDVALMFVPSETVYYELLMTQDNKGQQLDAYCREKSILAVSPNTLYAHLCVIAMGLRGMQIEENAKRLGASLDGMQKQMDSFNDVFEKLGTHLKNAQQNYDQAEKRLEKAQNTLANMVLDAQPNELTHGPVQAALPLPAEPPVKGL